MGTIVRFGWDPRMDATAMFLVRHERMHAHVERLTVDLSEQEIREPVHPMVNPLAWLLWHITRAEDSSVNLLVVDGSQVLDEDWPARLNVERRDVGTGMTMAEVVDLSRRVHLPSLAAYWRAVGEKTAEVVSSLRASDLDEVVDSERIHRFVAETAAPSMRADLETLWQNTTRGHFLVWLPLTHNYEHVGQADLLRGLLGHRGRF